MKRRRLRGLLLLLSVTLVLAAGLLAVSYLLARRIADRAETDTLSWGEGPKTYAGSKLSFTRRNIDGGFAWVPHWQIRHTFTNGVISTTRYGWEDVMESLRPRDGDRWQYAGEFHRAIKKADRMVLRGGGFDCCESVKDGPILVEITNREEVAAVQANLLFLQDQVVGAWLECGFVGVDWYRGRKLLARTACVGPMDGWIRWRGFPGPKGYGDAGLTETSREWMSGWLDRHIPAEREDGKGHVSQRVGTRAGLKK